MNPLVVRDLALADRDAALDVRHRSFGRLSPDAFGWWDALFEKTVAARRALGVYEGDRLVAMARLHAYRQFWAGRSLPMSGVAGVVVAPECRGRGVATLLMTAALERAVELGDAVSTLFPAAVPPYRRLGFELAGVVTRTTFPAAALRRLGPPIVEVRRPSLEDVDRIIDLMRREERRSRASGPLELTRDDVAELLTDDDNFCYLAGDGFLLYAWDGEDLRVERLVAESAETTRALWAIVGSGSSTVRHVYTYQPMHDPIHWLIDEEQGHEVRQERWMLRVLDARAAVAGRGYSPGLVVDVPLSLHDPLVPGCAGSYVLRVSDGSGELVPTAHQAAGAVRLGPNGLAALYAGTPTTTLRRAKLVTGGTSEQDELLDAAFASHAYLIDTF